MDIIRPQLDQVRIEKDGRLPFTLIDAITRIYNYLATSLNVAVGAIEVIQDTHANRNILFPASGVPIGSLYFETDRTVMYVCRMASLAHAWVYVGGVMSGLFAARPADLVITDAGFLFTSTNSLDYRWSGTAWVTLGTVKGGGNLSTVGRLTKVSAAGTINESAVNDDGTTVTALLRLLAQTGAFPAFAQSTTGGTQPVRYGKLVNDNNAYWTINLVYDGANFQFDDIAKPGMSIVMSAGTFFFSYAPAAAVPVFTTVCTIDSTGNLDVFGIYKVGGVSGQSNTITYGSSLGGVIPPGLTLTTKTVTFTGGIETGHT